MQCCGHIDAHDCFHAAQTGKHLLRTQNFSERNQKHFCVRAWGFGYLDILVQSSSKTSKEGNSS